MKLKHIVTVEEISLTELASLISIGIEDSGYLLAEYDRAEYDALRDKSACDFREDRIARLLLAGKEIVIVDYNAEGETYDGAGIPAAVGGEGEARYTVDLKAILKGLSRAASGEVAEEPAMAKKAFDAFLRDEEEPCFDAGEGDTLWQSILFGEIIYG